VSRLGRSRGRSSERATPRPHSTGRAALTTRPTWASPFTGRPGLGRWRGVVTRPTGPYETRLPPLTAAVAFRAAGTTAGIGADMLLPHIHRLRGQRVGSGRESGGPAAAQGRASRKSRPAPPGARSGACAPKRRRAAVHRLRAPASQAHCPAPPPRPPPRVTMSPLVPARGRARPELTPAPPLLFPAHARRGGPSRPSLPPALCSPGRGLDGGASLGFCSAGAVARSGSPDALCPDSTCAFASFCQNLLIPKVRGVGLGGNSREPTTSLT
jgi:hypothetical protein